jgi:putative hydroxymethylpyrimidine transport system ATP-binding protein
MSKIVVEFDNVSFSYQGEKKVSILDSFNLEVFEGEFISIIGASGSGKSTLFRLLTGLEQPDSGDIQINGQAYADRLGLVGYMPQQDLLMPWRTIVENAALPLEIKGMKKEAAYKEVLELLEEFGLKGYEHQYPGDLSGGMKQRVSFLRTILSGSNVLLLDEPFSALDAITRLSMQEWLLAQWDKRKNTVLFITHDVNEALFLSDRIFVFSNNPVTKLEELKVPLERPRSLRDLNAPSVITLKDTLLDQLRAKVGV